MARKMISVEVDAYIDFEYTPVRDMIKELTQVVEKYEALGFSNLYFQSNHNCGCYHSCNCSPRLVVYGSREETDAEHTKRVAAETTLNMRREARERAEYERLRKQFGN